MPASPYFDRELNAWVISRYRDVWAALREPGLVPSSPQSPVAAVPFDRAVHLEFRAQALRGLTPVILAHWEAEFVERARRSVEALPSGQPVDLIAQYARPWALEVAGIATGVTADRLEHLSSLAIRVFEAAGEPYDADLAAASQKATVELGLCFRSSAPLAVQMFVALAHSLPAFLGNAWLALLEHPAELTRLRSDHGLLPAAMEELLRIAGPAKVQFRQSATPVTLGAHLIPQGCQVLLRIDLANRDPEIFPEPNRLQLGRTARHLSFGSGDHACVGASLVRSAALAATAALLDGFPLTEQFTAGRVECFGLRYLKSLIVFFDITGHGIKQ